MPATKSPGSANIDEDTEKKEGMDKRNTVLIQSIHLMSFAFRLRHSLCLAGVMLAFSSSVFGQEIEVFNGQNVITNGQTNPPVSFGIANVGAAGPVLTFTVSNAGSAALVCGISNLTNLPAGFTLITNLASNTIAASNSESFSLQLDTSSAGTPEGEIVITNNVSGSNPFVFAIAGAVAINPLTNSGSEFAIVGSQPGDQVLPSLSLTPAGGVMAWQDNSLNRTYVGIGASLLNSADIGSKPFRVNRTTLGNHIKPQVQLLANGSMIFVWQSSVSGIPCIYARFAKPSEKGGVTFSTGEIRVNTFLKDQQVDPAVAALPNGDAVITWSSFGEDGTLWGVYARQYSATGKPETKKEFLVNQYISNQRNPAVAALANGSYVITWISDGENAPSSVDVYARVFSVEGSPVTDEIQVNTLNIGTNSCATPAVAPLNDGGFTVVWAEQNPFIPTNGWDVRARAFSASGAPEALDFAVNTTLYGDQYQPKIAAGSAGSLVVWTSMGQDGSQEGVYGRFLSGGTNASGAEFLINTTTVSKQMHQAVAWNGADHFLVVWTSFTGPSGFDLFGQSYVMTP